MKEQGPYAVRYRDGGPALGAADLDGCEQKLGLAFPTPYREFLLAQNGGSPSPACFLLNHVMSPCIERFHSIHSADPADDLGQECERLRTGFQMPAHYISIARTAGDGALLLCCAGEDNGHLYYWPQIGDGFRLNDPEFDTVSRLYFGIEELPSKLGPARNRKDRDALFFRLYWAASIPQSGAKTAEQLVAAGYDINFVLPGFRHPAFAAIDGDAFNVAERLIALGTRGDHIDRQNGNATVADRLNASLIWWNSRLSERQKGETVYEMAVRRLRAIESSLQMLEARLPG